MTRHDPRASHVSLLTYCPRCSKAGRKSTFLLQETLLDGLKSVLATRCPASACGYCEIRAMDDLGSDERRDVLAHARRLAASAAIGWGLAVLATATLLIAR